MTVTQLDCLQCGASYDYIGGSSHVLECPDCESTCVSPVGKLHIEGSDYWSAPNGTGELQISAVDEHDRHVEFCIGFQRSSGKLTQITIEENSIQAQQCSVVWPVKELFAEQLSEFGITELINPMGTDADNPTQR